MNDIFPNLHWTNLLIIPGMLLGFTVHELGHALAAYFLGDHSQVEQGKITLNPLKHICYIGSFAFLLTGYFGWPKALQVNPNRLRRQYVDLFIVALAGPLATLTLSLTMLLVTMVTVAIVIQLSGATSNQVLVMFFPTASNLPETLNVQAMAMTLTGYVVISSFWLTITSLLPLPGFDGFTAIVSLVVSFRERRAAKQPSRPAVSGKPLTAFHQQKRRNSVADIHFKAGTEYHDAKQYEDAIARYRQAVKSDDKFGPAYINMGLAYLAKGRRREAIQAFRGALQYANDQKSSSEAWHQLHLLSEVTTTDIEQAQHNMAALGSEPWTDIIPRPNWLILGIGSTLFVVTGLILYGYLLSQLINTLQ